MLRNKPRAGTSWMPSQVVYGIDTSDPDPEKWQKFGDAPSATPTSPVKAAPLSRPPTPSQAQ